MRQTHKAGEKLFVDYAGQTVPVIDSSTGDIHQAQIFVAVLGSSNYTYAEATWTQSLVDWISSHVRAFNFFGGVPELIVPDNLKSGVSKACRYEPDLNPTYGELAAHYDVAVLPARPRKPRDKAKVEVGVQIVERWILARLRKESFFSLGELNQRIRALITDLNCRPLKKLSTSRLSQFEALDKPALRPLPAKAYQYCDWKKVRVGFDYHIEIDSHYYSVPYNLVRQQIDIRLTANTVECFHKGRRVASHQRSHIQGGQTTVELHMPQAHRHHQQATPDSLRNWACQVGPATSALVEAFLNRSRHPQQGLRSCLALLSLSRRFGADRLEKASARALAIGSPTRDSVDCILKQGLDQVPLMQEQVDLRLPEHENLRGPSYYTEKDLIH